MSTLVWAVKESLLSYVYGMKDGHIQLSDGAAAVRDGFAFPAEDTGDAESPADGGTLAFRGSVTLVGHGGMMRVVIAEPRLVATAAGGELTIRDDEAPTGRMPFATLESLDPPRGTRLTADGADLFFGPYEEGTPLDDPRVTP